MMLLLYMLILRQILEIMGTRTLETRMEFVNRDPFAPIVTSLVTQRISVTNYKLHGYPVYQSIREFYLESFAEFYVTVILISN